MSTESARKAAEAIGKDISDRRGLKWEWEKIDEDVKQEQIYPAWEAIIAAACQTVAPPPESWRSLIGPQAEERCWERMCKSFHDKIADVLGLPHEPEPGFEPMLARIKQLMSGAAPAVSTPRCPRCGSSKICVEFGWLNLQASVCRDCKHEDYPAQFFQPAPSPPQWVVSDLEFWCKRHGYSKTPCLCFDKFRAMAEPAPPAKEKIKP